MKRLVSNVLGTHPEISQVLFCPKTGKWEGIYIGKDAFASANGIDFDTKIIHPQGPQDSRGLSWRGLRVQDIEKKRLGKVVDVEFCDVTSYATRIFVTKKIFGFFAQRYIFPLESILRIENGMVTVDIQNKKPLLREVDMCPA